jgi:hypothetical protein
VAFALTACAVAGSAQAGSAQAGSALAGSAQAGSAQSGSAQAASAQAAPAQTAPAQAAPAQAAPAQTGSAQAGSAQAASAQAAPAQAGSAQAASAQWGSAQAASAQVAPAQSGSAQAGSAQAGSAQAASAQAAPAQAAPAQAAPAQTGSAQWGSAQAASAQVAPAQSGSAQAASAQAAPAQAGSAQAGSAQAASAQAAPAQAAPAQTGSAPQTPFAPQTKSPAIALMDAADAPQWETWAKGAGWRVITPAKAETAIDLRVQALASAVQQAIQADAVDPARVYVAGRGDAAATVFYAISRVPDLWAAGVAAGGSPQPAIDSDRIFAANFTNVPMLWISGEAGDAQLAAKLKEDGLNVEWRSAAGVTNTTVLEWLAQHRREAFPPAVDCETNSPAFARCYWIEMTKFDVNERNDVLPSTRILPSSGAALDLGGFGYRKDDPGPGVLVSYLPEKYNGPLKMGDRIVALGGRPIENAKQYVEYVAKVTEETPIVATVQRGKERIRVETSIVLPRREPVVTARVQGRYSPEDKDIQITSRSAKEMRVTIPAEWADGARLYWNGLALEKIAGPGCYLLTMDREILHAAPCAK